uniref:Uncharacterized protein n=1 Tax=Solanum lycopersicum TaxID=4081 RepID=A0A3Q7GPT6_SOLLC
MDLKPNPPSCLGDTTTKRKNRTVSQRTTSSSSGVSKNSSSGVSKEATSKKFCYKTLGYPPDSKSNRKVQGSESGEYGYTSVPQAYFSYALNTNISEWGRKVDESQIDNGGNYTNTSATQHAVSNLDMMSKGSMKQLDTPSGNTTQVTLVGNYDFSANKVVTNIFCLPAFQHNLLHNSMYEFPPLVWNIGRSMT